MSGHNLFLGMYTFGIKRKNRPNSESLSVNDFLSMAYSEDGNKFQEGFVPQVIKLLDECVYKNSKNTHGATLEECTFSSNERVLDLLLNGGITGIKQYIIDEEAQKTELSPEEVVGMKFYGRIWLPSGSNAGFLFIQKYGSLSIMPIFESIIKDILGKHNLKLVQNRLIGTTTNKRLEHFLKYSSIRDVVIVSKKNLHSSIGTIASSATIRLKNIIRSKNQDIISGEEIQQALKSHGFTIGERDYDIKATYEQKVEDYKEEKTVSLDSSNETVNIIPNIVIPKSYINEDNSPNFEKMKSFVDSELEVIMSEAKK